MHHPYSAYWAICAKDTGKMVGWACLTNIHYINSSAETGAIVIGDPQYRDGYAWIETILFMLEYAFERLNLNRLYGKSILGHKSSNMVEELMFMPREGLLRQAAYKNGRFYDVSYAAILRDEYYAHKNAGDYEMPAIIRRLKQLRKSSK
jgi:RimJ/RimL family protein N-acetyltransferase